MVLIQASGVCLLVNVVVASALVARELVSTKYVIPVRD